ncbi:hypothetical protein HF526_06975 [Pseudonocardia sp. K10HN5]|uniref:ATP-dependent DNA ligase family profile domain-containing protein n=1 Tax=Pseudonocardia acidicola TaxID=2724939 RepID=A0ABX1S6A8_9PSEU|nr:hypothetical protein [Pseudonocardia acidicola]
MAHPPDGPAGTIGHRRGCGSHADAAAPHVQDATRIRQLTQQVPVVYYAFDVLYRDGRLTIGLPYRQRRRLLESLELHGPHWDTPPYRA